MARVYNFSAGPSTLPEKVLKQAADDGYLKLMILENSTKAQDVLKGLRLHLTELSKQYPENIKVIYRRCNNA